MTLIVAIDGPAAAGKGTLARRLAAAFDLPYLDTGLLYRAVGRKLLLAGADPADAQAATLAAHALVPEDLQRTDLRGPDADRAASLVASVPGVRAALLAFQRSFARNGAVLDGRDIGTVIFPDAPIKLFVTATVAARAQRRWRELTAKGEAVSLPTTPSWSTPPASPPTRCSTAPAAWSAQWQQARRSLLGHAVRCVQRVRRGRLRFARSGLPRQAQQIKPPQLRHGESRGRHNQQGQQPAAPHRGAGPEQTGGNTAFERAKFV
jgi:cytidylate kinase